MQKRSSERGTRESSHAQGLHVKHIVVSENETIRSRTRVNFCFFLSFLFIFSSFFFLLHRIDRKNSFCLESFGKNQRSVASWPESVEQGEPIESRNEIPLDGSWWFSKIQMKFRRGLKSYRSRRFWCVFLGEISLWWLGNFKIETDTGIFPNRFWYEYYRAYQNRKLDFSNIFRTIESTLKACR